MSRDAANRELFDRLTALCGSDHVLIDPDELLVYECDAYPLSRARPRAVVFPTSTATAAKVLALLNDRRVPFVPRGAGTSLTGGAVPLHDSICVSTAKMRRIRHIDLENEAAVVEAGVVTQDISKAVQPVGYHYAPDPSSQSTCTIGGNVASNAGGPHTLKYGVTNRHVLGLTVVLPHGEVLTLGGARRHVHGYDLTGLFVGSEGTLGLVTEITVRLTRLPPALRTVLAVFDEMDHASEAVSHIISSGILPAALEMMDQAILNILEDAYGYGFPRDADAILLIEIDGIEQGLDHQVERVLEICRQHQVRALEHAATREGRELLWKARKTAFGALGRLARTCITQDGVVPRSRVPHILRFIREVADKHDLRVANNFHAGDGNIHPNFLLDGRDRRQVARAAQASLEILRECVRLGGSVSGEHGIGLEKIEALKFMYDDTDLEAQQRLKGLFDPHGLANPGKVFGARTTVATEPSER